MAETAIPAVDLTRDDAPETLRRACEEIGFFTVVGHGVDRRTIDEIASVSRRFFDAPDAEKERFAGPGTVTGLPVYRPLRSERLGATGDGQDAADLKESLDWGPSLDGVDWPGGLQRPYVAYLHAMHVLARRLRGVIAVALGRDAGWFEDRFDDLSSTLRVINYPEVDADLEAGQLRAGAHRDYGFLTILRSDDAPGGLEVQTLAGDWVPVAAGPEAFVCNIGDLLADLTDGAWTSTLHRVAVPPQGTTAAGARRQSIVFFHNPSDEESRRYILAKAAAALGSS
jgi:isopenicillin N synthase-like dioxygenase